MALKKPVMIKYGPPPGMRDKTLDDRKAGEDPAAKAAEEMRRQIGLDKQTNVKYGPKSSDQGQNLSTLKRRSPVTSKSIRRRPRRVPRQPKTRGREPTNENTYFSPPLLSFFFFPSSFSKPHLSPPTATAPLPVLAVPGHERMRMCQQCGGTYQFLEPILHPGAELGRFRWWRRGARLRPCGRAARTGCGADRDGLSYYQNRAWANAVSLFKQALGKWPENQDFRANLANAEKALKDEQSRQAVNSLDEALKRQQKKDSVAALDNALREQENRRGVAALDTALKQQQEARKESNNTKQDLIKKQEARIDLLLQKMKVDQQTIRTLGIYDPRDPEARAKDFEEWAHLASEAKLEFEKECMDSLLVAVEAGVTEATFHGAKKAIEAEPLKNLVKDVDRKIVKLQALGIGDPYFYDAMRAVAKASGNPEVTKKLVERLEIAAKVVESQMTPDLRSGEDEKAAAHEFEQMDGLAAVLGIIDSKYKVLAADFRFTSTPSTTARRDG